MPDCLTIRHFFWGSDIALPRLWPFHDLMAARTDIDYRLHLVGRYPAAASDISGRSYVTSGWRLPRRRPAEAWIIRGWNRPQLLWRSVTANACRVPVVMWAESPGRTFEATTPIQAARIAARERILPHLFRPYGERAVLLGTGAQAVAALSTLAPASHVREFPYPNSVADQVLYATTALGRTRAAEDEQMTRLLFVGSFSRTKAVDLIIEACEQLWNAGERFQMRYVGEGPLKHLLEAHAARHPEHAELFPFATGPALTTHYVDSSAVLLPSRRDGWGLTIHEGLAAGMPVLTTVACGAYRLVSANDCGTVVASNDVTAIADGIRATLDLARHSSDGKLAVRARAIAAGMTMPQLANELIEHCQTAVRLARSPEAISS